MIRESPGSAPPCPTLNQDTDPVVQGYRTFFAVLDWTQVPERDAHRLWPGSPPHPWAAYVKALLVKLCEHQAYITHLRQFLVAHPLLVLELGFRPVLAPETALGFDVDRTVPSARWLRHQQQHLDHAVLQALLRTTVHALQAAIPDLGTTVAVDVKHIYAWVQENNPKAYLTDRHNPEQPPRGDRDCRLGVKRRSNQRDRAGRAEWVWGYGSGLVSATSPDAGDVVLAELTQPFNANDMTYFHPLYDQAVATLGRRPTNVAADAAFDAWHVYETCAETGGLAAIPLNTRGQGPPDRDAQGVPRCAEGFSMVPTTQFRHEDGYRVQRYGCPLLRPRPTGQPCGHAQFGQGGCHKTANLERGGQLRVQLDRQSPAYHTVYRQRTSAERMNSQATAFGIERPKVRNGHSVQNLNTLTYIVIDVQVLQRVRARKAPTPPPALC